MIPQVLIDGRAGFLFRSTLPGTYCFVPVEFVTPLADQMFRYDELAYVQDGWSVRNMRWAHSDPGGAHLFPSLEHPVTDLEAPAIKDFLQRVSNRTNHPFNLPGPGSTA